MENMKRVLFKIILSVTVGFVLASCSALKQTTHIVLLPDTQGYAEKYPEILNSQIDWIVQNADDIDLVIQQGDLTNNNNDKEWKVVQSAFQKLNNRIPYVLAIGNHDMGSEPGKFADTRNTENFNTYFPYESMRQLPSFGGAFKKGEMENAYYLFNKGKQKWLILTLEFGPRDEVLEWAGQIAKKYADRLVILNTHCYMYSDSTRVGEGDKWNPHGYGIGKNAPAGAVNDGEQIWKKLVAKHPNIRFVFSGHILNGGVGTLISKDEKDLPVYQFLANYQGGVKGAVKEGNGFLRKFNINFRKHMISVRTYSPYINEYMTSKGQQFEFDKVYLNPN